MTRDNAISRRTALKLTGAAAATALVAGCGDDDDNGGNGNGDDETFSIDPGTDIVFFGNASYWEGKEPSDIEGVENPTLALQSGETYNIGWDEGDGSGHNIEIWDSDDELIEDYETEITEEPEDEMLEIEVTDEMAYYVCEPHSGSMRGEIEVE
ncbi:plastocyanin/azurin family copper-binding protein [Natronorubrum sp. DTA7]|uniref:plastocyanin/azurin family copper-binding protein n=1 Tax=Natronorubrum sp. DTA7 TaxID=3447016 RepID=UPI003F8276E1